MSNENLTKNIDSTLLKIARRLASNEDEAQDCLQEARLKIISMEANQTDSYYIQYGMRKMQEYLRKERLFSSRHLLLEE